MKFPTLLLVALLTLLSGCAGMRGDTSPAAPDAASEERKIAELGAAIAALGAKVDRDEARRAAEVAVRYPLQLAERSVPAAGDQVVVNLNGRRVCQTTLPGHKRAEGFLGFQFHTGRVQFRDLRLKPSAQQ